MAEKRRKLGLKGLFKSTDAVSTVAPDVPSRQVPALYRNPEDEILRGHNPFFIWSRSKLQFPETIAPAIGTSVEMYKAFEKGQYRGLTDEHILKFCRYMGLAPHKLVGKHAMPNVLMQLLVRQSLEGSTQRVREDATFALRNHCLDARTAMHNERTAVSHTATPQHIIAFLDMLMDKPFQGFSERMEAREMLATMIDFHRERLADLKAEGKTPDPDPVWRVFCDCTLRLYGPGKAAKVWDNIRYSTDGGIKSKEFKFSWDVFADMVRRDPELLAPMVWYDEDSAHIIDGRAVNADGAVKIMLGAYVERCARGAREREANAQATKLESQIKRLETWGQSQKAQDVMTFWDMHNTILASLREDCPPVLTPERFLPAPGPVLAIEYTKKGPKLA